MQYAKVLDKKILEYRDDPPEGDQSALAEGKPRWVPVVSVDEEFDQQSEVRGDRTETVEADRVVRSYAVRAKTQAEINAEKAGKYDAIEEAFQKAAYAPIFYAVAGVGYEFHADRDAIENVVGVVQMILAGLPVPNPREWTPKGFLEPITMTHAEIIGLGAAIAARKDALFTVKKTRQRALMALTSAKDVAAFDESEGF